MTISSISAAARSTQPVVPVQDVEVGTRDPRSSPLVEIDKKTQQPVPLRFPWLSRLSTELEKAAGHPAPFKAPELGDSIDTRA